MEASYKMQAGKYNIKAVSKLLDIKPGTLRAWERRYQFIAPIRNDAGHRLYTEEHIKTLKWLKDKIDQGFTISQSVTLLENGNHNFKTVEHMNGNQSDAMASGVLDALLQFDETKAHMLLNQAFSIFTVEKAVSDVVGNILVRIGQLWEAGKITSAHEHFATSILRARISFIMHTIPVNGMMPKAVAVCGPGEWHELGLIIFTIFLRRKGMEVIYLGPSIVETDLPIVIQTVKPDYVFFSCTLKHSLERVTDWLTVNKGHFPGVTFGIGGSSFNLAATEGSPLEASVYLGDTEREWEAWLFKNQENK
jgi:MerR family transcriptional regulator, light-induced transcriptional regulator